MSTARKFRVALYARVSTNKGSQDESPEGQFDDLRSYFSRRDGYEIVLQESDRVSGARGERDRPGLAKILDAARMGKIDLIGVTRIDRLFRSLPKWVDTSRELEELGVGIVYSDHPELDPTTPMGKLMSYVLAALAEFFRDVYGNKAIEGKARAAAQGKHCARPREIVPLEALRMVHSWVLTGLPVSWREMSERLERSGYLQPGRVIKTTGRMRQARAWNPGTLWKAYEAYRNTPEALDAVRKTHRNAAPRTGANAGPPKGQASY